MNKLFNILTLVAVLLVFGTNAFSQSQPTFTTLAAAIADERQTIIRVTSATGFTASTQQLDYGVFIDHEFMRITAVSGTFITVQRGQAQTTRTAHKNAATAYVGLYGSQLSPGYAGGPFAQQLFSGGCTASAQPFLPVIQVSNSAVNGQGMYNCLGGQWYFQTLVDDQLTTAPGTLEKYCTISGLGQSAYSGLGTDTANVSGSTFVASFYVPNSFIATGASVLNGGTVGTDNQIYILFDAGGNVWANTALAGTLSSTANSFQTINFTSTKIVTGPARYFLGLQANGSTASHRLVAASTFKGLATAQLGAPGVFGTEVALTMPTTFTATVGPIGCLF